MRARDLQRRERVLEVMAQSESFSAEDYYHAACIMNHGDSPQDAEHAHTYALRSSELGHRPARWLMYQGKPQKYGMNYTPIGHKLRIITLQKAQFVLFTQIETQGYLPTS
jgi:hypothetical protein